MKEIVSTLINKMCCTDYSLLEAITFDILSVFNWDTTAYGSILRKVSYTRVKATLQGNNID